jgi:hypothetical protein
LDRNAYKHQQITGRDHFEDLHTDGKTEVTRIFKKKKKKREKKKKKKSMWAGFSGSVSGLVADVCEYGMAPDSSIKCWGYYC